MGSGKQLGWAALARVSCEAAEPARAIVLGRRAELAAGGRPQFLCTWASDLRFLNIFITCDWLPPESDSRDQNAFYGLASHVTHCYFSAFMLATQVSPNSVWELFHKCVSTRRYDYWGPFWKLASTDFYM